MKQRFASVNSANQKSNLTLVGAVAFLMSFISSSLPDTDYRDDDTDDRHYNTLDITMTELKEQLDLLNE